MRAKQLSVFLENKSGRLTEVSYHPIGASALLRRNLLIYGVGGVLAPFVGIKLIDMFVSLFF